MEAYSYKTNEWMYVASMNTRRSSVGVGVVDGQSELCVNGFNPLIHRHSQISPVCVCMCVCVCVCECGASVECGGISDRQE